MLSGWPVSPSSYLVRLVQDQIPPHGLHPCFWGIPPITEFICRRKGVSVLGWHVSRAKLAWTIVLSYECLMKNAPTFPPIFSSLYFVGRFSVPIRFLGHPQLPGNERRWEPACFVPCSRNAEDSIVEYHSNFFDYTTPCIFQGWISVIVSPPITPNKFWGCLLSEIQENCTTLACPYIRKNYRKNYTIFYTKNILRELIGVISSPRLHQAQFREKLKGNN